VLGRRILIDDDHPAPRREDLAVPKRLAESWGAEARWAPRQPCRV